MTKELYKAIMKSSKSRSNFWKSKPFSDRKTYTLQPNFCKKLLGNTKRTYFNNLDIKKLLITKHFGNCCSTVTNSFSGSKKTNLTEVNEMISIDNELSQVLVQFFQKQ